MLTRKQYDLLMFIHESVQNSGVSPSFDEMKDALALKSKSGIHRLIMALEERGYIRRLPHRARALEVVRLPENVVAERGAPAQLAAGPLPAQSEKNSDITPYLSVFTGDKGAPVVRRGTKLEAEKAQSREYARHDQHDQSVSVSVPLVGRIAAGAPIEALQNPLNTIPAPSDMISAHGEHFALEVRGDSMIEAGIHDGDIVVIRKQDTASNGDIVVALIEDQEATLKRLRRGEGNVVALEAANRDYETRIYPADRVQVQGRLVGLIRTY